MHNQDLRQALVKIQDHLSEDDRKRLNFFLSQNGTARAVDSEKNRGKDMMYLIKVLEQLHCDEAVKILKEYINPTQSTVSSTLIPDDQKLLMHSVRIDQKHCCDSNNTLINSNNTNVNPVTIVLGGRSKKRQEDFFKISSMITEKCLLFFIILSIILTILVIVSFVRTIDYENRINKQLVIFELKLNQTVERLINPELHQKQSQFTEESTCNCAEWCKKSRVCENGHTCFCRHEPLTSENLGGGCTCDSWCRKRDFKNGGICGDENTCICSK